MKEEERVKERAKFKREKATMHKKLLTMEKDKESLMLKMMELCSCLEKMQRSRNKEETRQKETTSCSHCKAWSLLTNAKKSNMSGITTTKMFDILKVAAKSTKLKQRRCVEVEEENKRMKVRIRMLEARTEV